MHVIIYMVVTRVSVAQHFSASVSLSVSNCHIKEIPTYTKIQCCTHVRHEQGSISKKDNEDRDHRRPHPRITVLGRRRRRALPRRLVAAGGGGLPQGVRHEANDDMCMDTLREGFDSSTPTRPAPSRSPRTCSTPRGAPWRPTSPP
jgi:hypothetical protein